MKTIRGCLVIFFSLFGLNSLAQALDPVSDDAETVESWDEMTDEYKKLLKQQIELQRKLGQDTKRLEVKLEIIDTKPSDNNGW